MELRKEPGLLDRIMEYNTQYNGTDKGAWYLGVYNRIYNIIII